MKRFNKKGIVLPELKDILIAILLLVVLVFIYMIFSGKGGEILNSIKDLMRFGR